MERRHTRTYEALKAFGFSAFKALEIVIDAQRGDHVAITMAKFVLRR